MDYNTTREFVDKHWDSWFCEGLKDFINVPNLTPMVDSEFLSNGLIEQAAECLDTWVKKLDIKGITRKEVRMGESICPLYIYVVDGEVDKTVMMYGHLDKQPYNAAKWSEGLHPTKAVVKDGWLYGRGGADDGYAPFLALLAVKNAQMQGAKIPRIALVLETEEESGSPSLTKLLETARPIIGNPAYCICLDSGAFDYKRLWLTSSLRGICVVDVNIQAGAQGYHSGETGGIIPETARVARVLMDRVDDSNTGKVLIPELQTEIPTWAKEEAKYIANLSGDRMYKKYNFTPGVEAMGQENLPEMYLNNTWRANASITGADGFPPIKSAGNVVRSKTSYRISMRLPPNCKPVQAVKGMHRALSKETPYNCQIELEGNHTGSGWCMKEQAPWFDKALKDIGTEFYGEKPGSYGMGGSIPFLSELEIMFPSTNILALGIIGEKSNAHGPDEGMNLDYTKRLLCCVSHLLTTIAAN